MSTFFINFFHMRAIFCFFPAILMSSPYTDRNNPCFRWTNIHSQFDTFSQPSSINACSNCLSHKSRASGCPYRFRSRGTTGSSMYAHDFGHFCLEDVSIHPDILVWEFWIVFEHPPFLPGCSRKLRQLLVRHNQVVPLRPSFVMLMSPVQ